VEGGPGSAASSGPPGPLREVATWAHAASAPAAARPLPELVEAVEAGMRGLGPDEYPRELVWSEGLDGLALLPLDLLHGLPVGSLVGGRPCLVLLANLWLHAVSPTPPDLE
jgi:hypothetical protein